MRRHWEVMASAASLLAGHAYAQCIISQVESNGVGIPVGCPVAGSPTTTSSGADSPTVISTDGGDVTIPTGISTLTTIYKSGTPALTFSPNPESSSISASASSQVTVITTSGSTLTSTISDNAEITTTNSAQETVISDEAGIVTIPTGLTESTVLGLSGSNQVTWFPPDAQSTQSDSPQATMTSSTTPPALLIPVTTQVDNPKPNESGSVIPCKNWFFTLCIAWNDIDIGGWLIDGPPGDVPPGPPPPFTTGPHFSISVTDPMPPWPKYTIGPDHTPTFPANPGDDGCQTATAKYCATTTSFGVSTSGSVTSTTKTSVLSTCGTLTGCGATGTSSATATTSTCAPADSSCPTASTYPYVIYPADGQNTQQIDALADQLKIYTPDSSKIIASNTKNLGLNYWQLPLNDSVVEDVRKLDNVAVLGPQCDPQCKSDDQCIICYDPTTSVQYQDLDEGSNSLPFVSWPPNHGAPIDDKKYYFDDTQGEGVTVYILDTGANLDHPEFSNSELLNKDHNVRWIHVNTDLDGRTPNDDSQTPLNQQRPSKYKSHGTSMLSLVAGNTLGIAKQANVVIVRLPRRNADNGQFTKEDFLDGLSRIEEDIVSPADQGVSAIVLVAHAYPRDTFLRRRPSGGPLRDENGNDIYDIVDRASWTTRVKLVLLNIASKGGLVITGAGNVGGDAPMWPAQYASKSEKDPIDGLLVVGAVSNDGQTPIYDMIDPAKNGIPHVFAPGDWVRIADGQPSRIAANEAYRNNGRGTSEASAMTAGLAAYYLSLARNKRLPAGDGFTNGVKDLKDYIVSKAWSRATIKGQDFPGIWNGVTWEQEQGACAWSPNEAARRLRGRADTCAAPDTTGSPQASSTSAISSTVNSSAEQPSMTPPPTVPVTPLTEQPVVCNKESDFPGHGDIQSGRQKQYAQQFCELAAKVSPGNPKIAPTGLRYDSAGPTSHGFNYTTTDNKGVGYSYLIQWVDGCVTTVPEMDIVHPVPGSSAFDCASLLVNNYELCANGGVGGSSQAGCVRYTFMGGLGAPPPCDGCMGVHF